MLLEPVRIVADWLVDASYGVDALATVMEVDAGDSQPGAVVVGDETRSGRVARGELPKPTSSASNLIAVTSGGSGVRFDGGVLTTIRDGQMPILIKIGTPNVASDEGTRDGLYLARAVFQSLKILAQSDHSDDRTRNNIHIKDASDLSITGVFQAIEDSTVTCVVQVTYNVRDLTP